MKRLVNRWRDANDLAWSTVGCPGPVFSNTNPGPDKDEAWEAHQLGIEAKQEAAGKLYREALKEAPGWLSGDSELVDKCFNRVFVIKGGAAIGPGILS